MEVTNPKRTPVAGVILCASLIGLFFLATIREGHSWHDDFAMYITHARNLATGLSYGESGYLYNPNLPVIGPKAYPPVLPILLSPLYRMFGPDLWPMKVLMVSFWTANLVLVGLLFSGLLPSGWLIGGIALLGLNPFFWGMKDNVISDLPFLFFFLLGLLLIRALDRRPSDRALPLAVLTGLALYLAYGTRTIGIVLVPILVICALLGGRRLLRGTFVALSVFAALAILQHVWLPGSGSGYADQFHLTPASLLRNLIEYTFQASTLFEDGHGSVMRKLIFPAMAALAAVGYLHRVRATGLTVLEVAPWLYGLVVLVWPSRGGLRLLIPIVPFFVLYALMGAHTIATALGAGARRVVLVGVLGLVGLVYADRYARLDFGPIRNGVTSTTSLELLEHIKRDTGPSDVLAFSKPRYLALATGRRSSACHVPADDRDLWSYLHEIRASHLIVGPDILGPLERDLRRFALAYPSELKPEFENADFTMYRIVKSPI